MTTALVLSAGGLYGAWEVGVWKAFYAHGGVWAQPDIVVGVSAGALNGWCISGGATPEELAYEWLQPRISKLMQLRLHSTGVFAPEVLHQTARELYARYKPRTPFGLTVVELPKFRTRLVRNEEISWKHLAATSSIPLGFPPVRIHGVICVDGGLMGALPLWAAEEMGATRAIAVNTLTKFPFNMLRKVLPLRRPTAAMQIISIEPSRPLGPLRQAVRWSAGNIARWIEQGEQDGNRAISSITM